MPEPDEYYATNTIPPLAWALELYLKTGAPYKDSGPVEVIFPAGNHKERMQSKGKHEIVVWITKRQIWARARCTHAKNCEFISERINCSDREAVKSLHWNRTDSRKFFKSVSNWLLKLNLDFVTMIRAINTICDRRVEIPLTSQYGKTFENFNEYRRERWPEEVTLDDRKRFLEEVLIRVAFWFQTAFTVGALK